MSTPDNIHTLPSHRPPPMNIEAEKAVLGAIFTDSRAYERVSDTLRPEHFAVPEHGKIFEAVGKLINQGQIADPVTLSGLFERSDDLQAIGGPVYLAELAASAVTIINAGEYGRIIQDAAQRREMLWFAQGLIQSIHDGGDKTAKELMGDAEAGMTALTDMEPGHTGDVATLSDYMADALEEIQDARKRGGMTGLATGTIDVDLILGGFAPGDFIIMAGGTSMGKTAYALGVALHNVRLRKRTSGKEGAVVHFVSLEMTGSQLAKRNLSESTGIPAQVLRRGEVDDWNALMEAATAAQGLPLFVDDAPGVSVADIRRRALRVKRKHGLGLLVIDYLQLIQADKRYAGQRVNEVGQISRSLKVLAKELDVPVIALSQLSRQVDQREDHRPRKSDLRESGSLEQDADTIVMLYRPEYYTAQLKPVKRLDESKERYFDRLAAWEVQMEDERGKAEVIIAKNRHGPSGKAVDVHFDAQRMTFGNVAKGGGAQ